MALKITHILFHTIAFSVYNFTLYSLNKVPNSPSDPPAANFIGKFKYLTFWNLIFQSIAFGLCLSCDFLSNSVAWGKKLTSLRDRFFLSVAIPFGLNVFFTFWALYFYDKELIFPKRIEAFYPPWLNHLAHTFIFFPLLIELWLYDHKQPKRQRGLSTIFFIIFVYGIWVIGLALHFGMWVYPFLAVLSWPGRFAFFGGNWALTSGFYLVGEKANKLLWEVKRPKKF